MRAVPSASPLRECAIDDCRRASILLALGDHKAAGEAMDLALGMLKTARKLDVLRGEPTVCE